MDAALHPEAPRVGRVPLRRALVMLGPPGAGKGTQSHAISREFGIPEISTGEMLREAVKRQDDLGRAARPIMEAGGLVPDQLVCAMVEARVRQPDCRNGFILDGFPRNLEQAVFLDQLLASQGQPGALVLNIGVTDGSLMKRLTGRRICPRCGTIYNIFFEPPRRSGVCDKDAVALVQRPDDTEDAVRTRLREYEAQTKPLIDYYRNSGVLREVDGNLDPESVTQSIFRLLKES